MSPFRRAHLLAKIITQTARHPSERRSGMQFTIRSLIVMVALVGLNLAAALATRQYLSSRSISFRYPHETGGPTVFVCPHFYAPDGSIHLPVASLETGERLERIVWPVPPMTSLQIWSPIIASGSITLLVLAFPWSRRPRQPPVHPDAHRPTIERSPCSHTGVARWTLIAASLMGLNTASGVYRPLSVPAGKHPDFYNISDCYRLSKTYSKVSFRREGDHFLIVWSDGSRVRPKPGDGDSEGHILETIIYRPDGAVVVYEGSPGLLRRLFTWPRVIEEPTRLTLEMWWPVIVTAAITLLVLRGLWLRARRQQVDATFWFGTD